MQMFNSSSFFHKGSKGALSVQHTQNRGYKERRQIKCNFKSMLPVHLMLFSNLKLTDQVFLKSEGYYPVEAHLQFLGKR